jgi:hypothetical protein
VLFAETKRRGTREEGIYHGNTIGAKFQALKHLYNEGSINLITSSVKIYLEKERVLPNLSSPLHGFPRRNNSIKDQPVLEKSSLILMNNPQSHSSNSKCKGLCQNLVRDTKKSNGPLSPNSFMGHILRDQLDNPLIKRFCQVTRR